MIRSFLLIAAFLFLNSSVFSESAWVFRKKIEGITIYTRPVPDTPYFEFRGITRVKTSLFSILALWADPDSYSEWMFNCKSANLLKQETPLSLYTYIITAVPWPLVDRDNILFAETYQDINTGKINIKLTGKPEYLQKDKTMIRVSESHGIVELNPVENGEIEVVFEFFMNPAGEIPPALVNLTVLDFPYHTLKKMREVVKKPKFQNANYEFLKNSL